VIDREHVLAPEPELLVSMVVRVFVRVLVHGARGCGRVVQLALLLLIVAAIVFNRHKRAQVVPAA